MSVPPPGRFVPVENQPTNLCVRKQASEAQEAAPFGFARNRRLLLCFWAGIAHVRRDMFSSEFLQLIPKCPWLDCCNRCRVTRPEMPCHKHRLPLPMFGMNIIV